MKERFRESRKIHALVRVAPYINKSKRRILMQFSYYLLTWMCCSCINNRKINCLHERPPQIIYQDKQPSFEQLLTNHNSVSIHQRNLHSLATEM